jgi:hypothetical protein
MKDKDKKQPPKIKVDKKILEAKMFDKDKQVADKKIIKK